MNIKQAIVAVHLAFALTCGFSQEVTTAGKLGALCLVTCQALNGQPTLMSELGSNDRCVGYLKGLSGGIEWANSLGNGKVDAGSCPAKFLADRTATSPRDDEVLVQSCKLASWLSDRPGAANRPAAPVVLGWMKLSRCE